MEAYFALVKPYWIMEHFRRDNCYVKFELQLRYFFSWLERLSWKLDSIRQLFKVLKVRCSPSGGEEELFGYKTGHFTVEFEKALCAYDAIVDKFERLPLWVGLWRKPDLLPLMLPSAPKAD